MPSGIKNCHTKHKTLLNPKLTLLKWTKAFNNLLKWQNFGKSGRTGSNATHHNPFESWCSDLSLSFFSFQPNSLSLAQSFIYFILYSPLAFMFTSLSLSLSSMPFYLNLSFSIDPSPIQFYFYFTSFSSLRSFPFFILLSFFLYNSILTH